MDDYIRKQDASDAVIKHLQLDYDYAWGVREAINGLSAADVVPVVHGKWINGRCNKCGEHAPFWAMASTYYTSNFCPNCGAKMSHREE